MSHTTLQQPWTYCPALTIWILAGVKTDLDDFLWTKNDFYYLDIKLKVFRRENKNAEFQLRKNFTMGEADFSQFIRQSNHLVVAAFNFFREQNLSPVLQSTQSEDVEEQLKLVHKVIDVLDRPKGTICVTLPRYKADNPDTSYAQGRLFGWNTEEEKFQQLCLSTVELTNLYTFMTSWIQCMIK